MPSHPAAPGRITDIGTIPPVAIGDYNDQQSASDLGFDDQNYDQEHSPYTLNVVSADSKLTATKHKPTFMTVMGGQEEQTSKAEAHLLNDIRRDHRRLDPIWLMQAQTALQIADASGAMNTSTLRVLLTKKGVEAKAATSAMLLDATFLTGLHPGKPFVAATDKDWFSHDEKDAKAHLDADTAAQAVGYEDYADYEADFIDEDVVDNKKFDAVTFLGVSMKQGKSDGRAHPYLVERLRVAETYLHQRFKTTDNAEVIKRIGWNKSGGTAYETDALNLRGRAERKEDKAKGIKHLDKVDPKSHQHTMGLAIDIDPGHNPWVYRGGAGNDWYDKHFEIAAALFGGSAITAADMTTWSDQSSTEELHAKITKSSDAFGSYLKLLNSDEETIQKQIEARYEKDPAKAKGLAADAKKFGAWFHGEHNGGNASELTNISMDLLVALRDVAGLSWGGMEMGHTQNGDFMHFDCRNTEFGHAVIAKKSPAEEAEDHRKEAERRKALATKAAKKK